MSRLLILDDNERFAETLKRSINQFDGYESETVEIAVTSDKAIELARMAAEKQQPFSVLLIDQNLEAEMDGIQAMKELLAIHADADTIIFTGYDTPEDGLRAYEEGAKRYLPKPFEPRELELVLKELVRSQKVRIDEARQQRQFKVATEIAEAVGASLGLESTMVAILETLVGIFEKTRLCVLLYDENALHFAPASLRYYQIDNPQFTGQDKFPLDGETIACRVAKRTLHTEQMEVENAGNVDIDNDYLNLNPETRSEFCISLLNTNHKLLGVLAMERSWYNGFEENDLALIKMAARHISLAIERAQQSEQLKTKSAIAAQTSWAATIAHELNNEVGKIINWAYVIQQKASEDALIFDYAKKIEESAYNLSSSNPWLARTIKTVEIDSLLAGILERITPLKSIEVDLQLNAAGIKVKIAPSQFQFIIKQLVNNAAKAMNEDETKRIIVSTCPIQDQFIEIIFQDFGPGISDENRMAIFKWQFTTKETGGFGLLFAHQMVEDAHGSITLLPYQPGKGATFEILLPIEKTT